MFHYSPRPPPRQLQPILGFKVSALKRNTNSPDWELGLTDGSEDVVSTTTSSRTGVAQEADVDGTNKSPQKQQNLSPRALEAQDELEFLCRNSDRVSRNFDHALRRNNNNKSRSDCMQGKYEVNHNQAVLYDTPTTFTAEEAAQLQEVEFHNIVNTFVQRKLKRAKYTDILASRYHERLKVREELLRAQYGGTTARSHRPTTSGNRVVSFGTATPRKTQFW
eukprot:PhF_6_TR8926/c0_g1_i1/m.14083